MKKCSWCKKRKLLEEFNVAEKGTNGRQGYCRQCQNLRAKTIVLTEEQKARKSAYMKALYPERAAKLKAWREKNPEKYREQLRRQSEKWRNENREWHNERARRNNLRSKWGMARADYETLLASQHNICAICLAPPIPDQRFHIDHDHETGVIRGLLCNSCNLGLGWFGDDPARLEAAAAYLRRYYAAQLRRAA